MINFFRQSLDTSSSAFGTIVVVDVLRAFTTTAFAFSQGATEIFLVSTVEEAFELKEKHPDVLLAGEVNGYSISGFDLPNSPTILENRNLDGQRLVLRTTAGTQGVVRAPASSDIYVASLSVATATANLIQHLNPETVTFIDSGIRAMRGGEEDAICSDYIQSLIQNKPLKISDVIDAVRQSKAAAKFTDTKNVDFLASDLELALGIDRFAFSMKVFREDNHLILRKVDSGSYR